MLSKSGKGKGLNITYRLNNTDKMETEAEEPIRCPRCGLSTLVVEDGVYYCPVCDFKVIWGDNDEKTG